MSSDVLVERHDGWAEVILNRPQRKNAVTQPLAAALRDAFLDVAGDMPGVSRKAASSKQSRR